MTLVRILVWWAPGWRLHGGDFRSRGSNGSGRGTMADSFVVIMAAYSSTGPAQQDFDALVRLVKDRTVASEGVILVQHDADGQVHVTQTGDHLGRKGLGWGGG